MIIYPSIDIHDGKNVKLTKGDFKQIKLYNNNLSVVASYFAKAGARWLHVVDLDGAYSTKHRQLEAIKKLVQNSDMSIQLSGGVRSLEDIKSLLTLGVKRVALGSLVILKPIQVRRAIAEFGNERITVVFDVRLNKDEVPMISTQGRQIQSDISLWRVLDVLTEVKHVIVTDIDKDGTLMGPNMELYHKIIQKYPHIELQASGGVKDVKDITHLKILGASGVIIGKSLYEGNFTLQQAIENSV